MSARDQRMRRIEERERRKEQEEDELAHPEHWFWGGRAMNQLLQCFTLLCFYRHQTAHHLSVVYGLRRFRFQSSNVLYRVQFTGPVSETGDGCTVL